MPVNPYYRDIHQTDLVKKISAKTGISEAVVNLMLKAFTETVSEHLQQGKTVSIKGFGSFETRVRQERLGTDPRNKTPIVIPKRAVPFFSPGKFLREDVGHAHNPRLQ